MNFKKHYFIVKCYYCIFSADNVYDVLPLCHEYQIEQLKAECENFLLKEVDEINIYIHQEPLLQRYALYADVYELPKLKEVCIEKLSTNRQ